MLDTIGYGLIKLSSGCDAISDNVLLHSQIVSAIDTIDRDFLTLILILNLNKLSENIKENNINVSELQLLNIGLLKLHLDINLLKTLSSSLNKLYKEMR